MLNLTKKIILTASATAIDVSAVAPIASSRREGTQRAPALSQSFGVGKALGPVAFAALTAEPGDFESGHFSQLPRGEIGIEYKDD
jgi:hypothetical protein